MLKPEEVNFKFIRYFSNRIINLLVHKYIYLCNVYKLVFRKCFVKYNSLINEK